MSFTTSATCPGAIAYYRGTGDRTLLDAGIRFVNDFLIPNYGPGTDRNQSYPDILRSRWRLIELYRLTGDKPVP